MRGEGQGDVKGSVGHLVGAMYDPAEELDCLVVQVGCFFFLFFSFLFFPLSYPSPLQNREKKSSKILLTPQLSSTTQA